MFKQHVKGNLASDDPFNNRHTTFTFIHLADAFIQSNLQEHSGYTCIVSMCVPWELNPQPLRC